MRGEGRQPGLAITSLALVAGLGCLSSPPTGSLDTDRGSQLAADDRAARRAFDGAPPVIPHDRFSSVCGECHNREGLVIAELGFAPPSPHAETAGMSRISRCRQCHVYRLTASSFKASSFRGLRQDLRPGRRAAALAPPVLPHPAFMRENCLACHAGPAAREGIRTGHPERIRCRQCHLQQRTTDSFEGAAGRLDLSSAQTAPQPP